jgi:hypothetical protein
VIVEPPLTVTALAAVPPNDTEAPAANPLPEIVTTVPPDVPPEFGATDDTAGEGTGADSYVNPPFKRPLCPSGFVTTMSAGPAARAGVVAVIDDELLTTIDVAAAPPTETVAPPAKPAPVIVTTEPPPTPPSDGEMPLTDGGVA